MRSNLVPTESPRSNAFHLPFDLPAPSDSRFGFALVAVDRVDNVQLAIEIDVTDPHSIAGSKAERIWNPIIQPGQFRNLMFCRVTAITRPATYS